MDSNPEILEQENTTSGETQTGALPAAREWPGLSGESSAPNVKFPGEDGGRSLAKMAERDLDAALQLLAERAQYITGATGAAIALRDGDEMVCRATAGGSAPEIGARLQMDSGLSGESIRTRTMLRCDDAQTDGRVNRESCEALGIASVVVMPMVDGGEVIGVFELFSDRAYAFEDRDIVALDRMGAMVRTAVDDAAGIGQSERIEPRGIAAGPALVVTPAPIEDQPPCIETAQALIDVGPSVGENLSDMAGGEAQYGREAEPEVKAVDLPTEMRAETTIAPETHVLGVEDEPEVLLESASFEGESHPPGDAPFLSEPEHAKEADVPAEPAGQNAKSAEGTEGDPGEMARDAAERTAAWKASLFEREAPAQNASSTGEKRIAFHMRVPKKPEQLPVESPAAPAKEAAVADANVVAASASASTELEKAETGIVEIEPSSEADETRKISADGSTMIAELVAEAPPSDKGDAIFAASSLASRGGSAAAAAPAKEMATAQIAQEAPNVSAASQSPPTPAKTTAPAKTEETLKAKPEIARPASAEGRAKIAVSQVRKCEACGFPVSEGRKLCLDCEKKAQKPGATPNSAASPAEAPATVAAEVSVTAQVSQSAIETKIRSLETNEAPAEAKIASTEAKGSAKSSDIAEGTIAIAPDSNKASARIATTSAAREPELPTLNFSAATPDHYESWIVSHMYTAVAIAVVAVGIVVYLLSR